MDASSPYKGAFSYLTPKAYATAFIPVQGDWQVLGPSGQVVLFGALSQTGESKLPVYPGAHSSQVKRKIDYSKVKSKITPEETSKYLERKRERETLRVQQMKQKEDLEMLECTFRPRICQFSKRMRI